MTAVFGWLRLAGRNLWIVALAAGAVALAVMRAMWRREAVRDAVTEGLQDANERMERGRHAVQDGRDSGLSPDERVRRNDDQW